MSSTGFFLGFGVSFFNTFGESFLKVVYDIHNSNQQTDVTNNFSLLFNLGGLLCCLTLAFVYEKYGRHRTIVLLQFFDIVCICIYMIKNMYFLYVCRFLHGYLGCAYGFISLIMIIENLPQHISSMWSSMFYTFVSIGYLVSYAFCSES